MAPKPPLGLSVVMRGPGGAETTWWSGSPRPGERPSGINFRTERGTGFVDASCVLSRDIRGEYVDLGLLDEGVFVSDTGDIAYEGALQQTPRTLDSAHSITPAFAGHMALAQDRPFSEAYCDTQFSSWGDMPFNEKARLLADTVDIATISWAVDGGLVAALPNQALGARVAAETWYEAPEGVLIGAVEYVGSDIAMPGGWEAPTLRAYDIDSNTGADAYAETFDGTVHARDLATPRRYLFWTVWSAGVGATPASGAGRHISKIAAYGAHQLTRRANSPGSPSGLWLTDILLDIARRFTPQLDTSGVKTNRTLIEHAVYVSQLPHDAWLDLNKYAGWELAVWEHKRLTYQQADLTDYDWEVRLSDPGVTTTLQGDDATNLRNGIVVQFTEAGSGKTRTLTPDDYPDLRDDAVENPANAWGRQKWGPPYQLSAPCSEEMALFAGRQKLAEDNQPREAGEIGVTGHVRDRAGHWQPVHKVRAGQTIAITDFPNARPRLIADTAYTHDGYQLRAGVDSTLNDVETFLDLYGAALQAGNLA